MAGMSHTHRDEANIDVKARMAGLPYWIAFTFSCLGILLTINQIFHLNLFGFMPIGNAYYYYILATFFSLVFLISPARAKDKEILPWYDWALFVVSVASSVYLALNAYNILMKGWELEAPFLPTAISFVLWVLALEGVRRAAGTTLFFICTAFSIYPIFAGHMPGMFYGMGFSVVEIARYHSMGIESIIGIPTRVVGDLLVGFMIFGVALVATGGGKFFMDFALSLMGHTRGGAAKVAVISSAFMGSLSGSVISNVVTIGTMTIPAMRNTGYDKTQAAAIEACASTGACIMPPIMGAAGFLIASFLNVPYWEVVVAAFFPATLYFLTLLLQVDLYAGRNNLKGFPRDQLPKFWVVLKNGWFYLGAVILLVFILMYLRNEAWAPFLVMIFIFACSMIRKETRFDMPRFVAFILESGKLLANITAILAGVGLIVGSLSGTGLGNSFSRDLVSLAGGNALPLLFLGAITSFILGIGMTVTACYLFLATVLVPALVQTGLNPMACHLFVLYWGDLSYITPPVALASITAAAIAGSDPMATGWKSIKLGAAKYIVPFFFALNPALILDGDLGVVILAVLTALLGCVFLAASLEGYIFRQGGLSMSQRIVSFAVGFCLMCPEPWVTVIGVILMGILIGGIKLFPAWSPKAEIA